MMAPTIASTWRRRVAIGAVPRARVVAETLLVAGLVLLAFAIRIRWLGDIPRYTDEVNETMSAIDIARGHYWPLVSPTKHIGAYFNYLVAGTILVFGKSPDLPRYVALVTGVATVLVVYGYGRRLGGPVAGAVGASLLIVSAPHVLLSSRVAWSASLTPLFVLGTVWAAEVAVKSGRPRLLLLAGLLAGLAFQAHPSVLALLPGLAVFGLPHIRRLICRPELYLAAALFALGCANVLVYTTQNGFRTARSVSQEYPSQVFGPAAYAANLKAPIWGIAQVLASAVDPVRDPLPTDGFLLLMVGVSALALVYAAWRRSSAPSLVMLSALVLFPFLHDDFDPLLKARYTMPLVPLTYVAIGVLIADLLALPIWGRVGWAYRLGAAGLWVGIMAGLLGSLVQFETTLAAAGCTNAPQRALVAEMQRNRLPGEWVLMDPGVVRPAERLGYLWLLEWSGEKVGSARLERDGVRTELAERPSFLTVVNDGKVTSVFEKQGLQLLAPAPGLAESALRSMQDSGRTGDGGTGLYRVTTDGVVLLAHQSNRMCDRFRTN